MGNRRNLDLIYDPIQRLACSKCSTSLDVSTLEPFSRVECPECGTINTVPAQLGSFLLLEMLGQGGMGAVYKALDQSLGRYVAIKVMKKQFGEDKKFVESFLREARAAAAINHRNVVAIYSFGEEKGQPYIVMELVDAGKLDEMISDGQPMDEVRALEIAVDVTEGLRAANDISLVHGDIKPANILFDGEGIAKVADFGLAQFANWEQEGEVWGTPYYIAPEKARGQKTDHRSDVYSLGATLYHVMGAKPPFDGKTATDVVLARLKNPAIGLRVIRPELQPETADLIARMLETDPFMRYPTYNSLLADMREALRVAKQNQRSLHSKVKKSALGPAIVIGFVALVAIGIAATSFWLARSNNQQQPTERQAIRITSFDELENPNFRAKRAAQAAKDGEREASPEADGMKPPVDEAEPEKVTVVLQPFTPDHEEKIAEAIKALEAGKATAAEERFQQLYDSFPKSDIGRYWIRLFQGVANVVDGRPADARAYFQVVARAEFPLIGPSREHPGKMAQVIAQFMLGQVDDGKLYFESQSWPPWFGDFSQFFMALDLMTKGNFKLAKAQLVTYSNRKADKPSWPYSLQDLAQQWIEGIDAWDRVSGQVETLVADKKATQGREALEAFRRRAGGVFYPVVDRSIARVTEAEQKEAEEQRIASIVQHQEDVQHDLDILDDVRASNIPLVIQKEFRRAGSAVRKLSANMKTPEGRDSLRALKDSYDQMDELKDFLIDSVKQSSHKIGRERVIDADISGLHVALGAHGAMLKPWEQVHPGMVVQLAEHYISNGQLSEDEQAKRYMNLAAYCYNMGVVERAGKYAEKASELNSSLNTDIRKLMPDVLPN